MIIHTGNRTDIPAFYSKWFINRLKAGFVLVRNPYNPHAVTRFKLNPSIVDLIAFCTKNPANEDLFEVSKWHKGYAFAACGRTLEEIENYSNQFSTNNENSF